MAHQDGAEWLSTFDDLSTWLRGGGHPRVTVERGVVVARIQLRETVEEYGALLQSSIGDAAPRPSRAGGARSAPLPVESLPPEQVAARFLMARRIQRFIRALFD